ncbi:MAG TPA: helix-turn-helix domain-containing protein [Actinomycetota bacterium]|nr:helix-turn-helix domain-containing protein [Actinomycetota bacterium]
MQDHDARTTEASPRIQLLSDNRLTWTITEAAQLLGISRATAYEAAHRGELPVRLIGRRMLVPRVALLRLLGQDSPPSSQSA